MMAHSHVKSHGHQCTCKSATFSVHQTLEEMQFERGIWYPAYYGDTIKLKAFLLKGVDSNLRDSSGYTALHYASRQGHLEACEELLRWNADPNAATSAGVVTPLHRAAHQGHLDIVHVLVKHGGHVDSADADGKTPLHKAAENGQVAVCEFLLKLRPEMATIKDNRQQIPADLANEAAVKEIFSKTGM